jgi:hypothetical protein
MKITCAHTNIYIREEICTQKICESIDEKRPQPPALIAREAAAITAKDQNGTRHTHTHVMRFFPRCPFANWKCGEWK